MTTHDKVTPLTRQRALATIGVVIAAVRAGEAGVTYSELARRLGMSKVNGQGLLTYLNEAAAICADHGLPNVAVMIASQESLEAGAPMPSDGTLSEGFYASTGLSREMIPAEQARVRAHDWTSVDMAALAEE